MMAGRITRLGATVTLAVWLAACSTTSSGYLGGRFTAPGRPVSGVELTWTQSAWGQGTMAATLPTGERFKGDFAQVTRVVPDTVLVPIVSPVAGFTDQVAREGGTEGENVWASAIDLDSFRAKYSDRIVATLFGDKGNAMRCGFRLFEPSKGLSGGGVGQCQISFGNGTIAVQF